MFCELSADYHVTNLQFILFIKSALNFVEAICPLSM